jgi:hypothetical protein
MKNKTSIIIGGIILLLISFYAGMRYGGNNVAAAQAARMGQFANGQFGGRGGMRGAAGGGATSGQIISKDAQSVTVQLRDGGSKIIFLSGSTAVMKAVAGSVSDLSIGQQVTAIGTVNADGSITAQSLQIRPATTTQPR